MRGVFYIVEALVVIAMAYWAYNENYSTQDALRRVDALQVDIGLARESLGVLRAEWAYLNRPDRLRELADLNFETLQLMPLSPEHFGEIEYIDFPAPPRVELEFSNTFDLAAELAQANEGAEEIDE